MSEPVFIWSNTHHGFTIEYLWDIENDRWYQRRVPSAKLVQVHARDVLLWAENIMKMSSDKYEVRFEEP